MKTVYTVVAIVIVSVNFAGARYANASTSCEREAIAAAKGFAADDGDEACAGEEHAHVTGISDGVNLTEVYVVDVDCGGGTSFTETVVVDSSCKVVNQH